MTLIGYILVTGGIALAISWPSDAIGLASIFVVACGFVFIEAGTAKPAPFDDLGRGRL